MEIAGMSRLVEAENLSSMQVRRGQKEGGMRKGWLSVGQAADQLQVSPSTVRNWVEKGYISAFRLPSGVRRIPHEEITRLVNDYLAVSRPLEGEDEASLVLAPEDESGVALETPTDPVVTVSSDRPSLAETERDQSIAR
jgi:excisionase family DNA binding protein